MPSMYGRANPKPEPPSFDAEDMRKMRDANEMTVMRLRAADADAAKRIAGMSSDIPGTSLESSAAWSDIAIPASLGFDHGQTKWRQNQTFVEIFVALPGNARRATDVSIDLQSDFLSVKVGETSVINGSLFRPVKAEASTWIISDSVLEREFSFKFLMLKFFSYLNRSFFFQLYHFNFSKCVFIQKKGKNHIM